MLSTKSSNYLHNLQTKFVQWSSSQQGDHQVVGENSENKNHKVKSSKEISELYPLTHNGETRMNKIIIHGLKPKFGSFVLRPKIPHSSSMANRQPQLTAATHLTTKLTSHNYPVWRKQVESTLISLELEDYITDESNQPSTTINDKDGKPIPNPEYRPWYCKDQMIFSAILGSCSNSIQPLISSASTAREAWERLHSSFASSSRSRIISLKSKLAQNPKGTRSVTEFLHEMRSIAANLALAQSPFSEEDLMVHILSQLGDDYRIIAVAIKVRENPISYSELFDKLTDYERALTDTPSTLESIPTTVNYTTRQQGSTNRNPNSFSRNNRAYHSGSQRGAHQSQSQWSNNNHNRTNKTNEFCQFCNIPGHLTRDCRKLARFLKDNNVQADKNTTPVANVTTSSPASPSWLFDTGASNHVTSDRHNLHSVSEYGGPDEVVLGDGTGLPISNIGTTYINTPHKQLLLSNLNNLMSIMPSFMVLFMKRCLCLNLLVLCILNIPITSVNSKNPCMASNKNPERVYVDDFVLTGNDTSFLETFVTNLANCFSIKDLGPLHHFLGVEVIPTPNGLFLSQHRHIQDLLTQFHMDGAKEVATPLNSSVSLNSHDVSASVDPTPYRRLVGSLQYLAFTRPDISFTVNKLSQIMHSPSELHWQSLKRVLRYLKGTVHHGLFLKRRTSLELTAFSDSDWGGIECGGRSTIA
ncbi:hypothetical protein LXL04_027378 [Taraxacum kok-saghyz]